ncbi:hypothetical protein ES703_01200 [subsurface metagenome]
MYRLQDGGECRAHFAAYSVAPLVAVDKRELHGSPLKGKAGDYVLIMGKQLAASVAGTNDIGIKEQEMGCPGLSQNLFD